MTHALTRAGACGLRASPGPEGPTPGRTAVRVAAGALFVVATLATTPALAEPAEGVSQAEPVSAVAYLLVLVAIPAGLALLISLLVVAPSVAKVGGTSQHGAWDAGGLWFGGPRGGVDAADEKALSSGKSTTPTGGGSPEQAEAGQTSVGGASGRW